jgi:hypothetical protein
MEKVNPTYGAVNAIASRLAKEEKYHGKGEGSEVKIGDFREILADLADMAATDPKILADIHKYGLSRKREKRMEATAQKLEAAKAASKKPTKKGAK